MSARRELAPTVRPPRRSISSIRRSLRPAESVRPAERATDPDDLTEGSDEDLARLSRGGREPTLVHAGAQIGPFTLLAPLGDGGMGKVWLAKHQGLRRRVALKVLHKQIHEVPDNRRRFEREALALGRLRHPGIVSPVDFGELPDGRNFLALEYVEGMTLDTVVRTEGPLPWRMVARIGAEAADALDYAHRHGVIHRDLKPDNLVIARGDLECGELRVLDLGLARIEGLAGESQLTDRGYALGTASYSAPEQLQGRATDARADIYGLGAVLYRLITGHPPHPGESFEDVVQGRVRGPIAALQAHRRDRTRPKRFDALIMHMLAHAPDDRPSHMGAVGTELAVMSIQRTSSWRRLVVPAALLTAGVVLGVGGAAAFFS
ncbi:MAG: serine/threonine-protein kinase [Sandaracinaceae bacterium]